MNRHLTFVSTQCAWYQSSNNTSIWMIPMFIPYKPRKVDFAQLLLPNHDPLSLWCKWGRGGDYVG
jgi:hypothetical protein